MEEEIYEELKTELENSDPIFNSVILESKIKGAIREVKRARKYPSSYTDEMVDEDLQNYYQNVKNIALYDYNMSGIEWQTQTSEAGANQSYVDRDKLFKGIVPIVVMV